jgi:hypothetical protein
MEATQEQTTVYLTLSQAADATGTSRSTIKRRRTDGAFPNAKQDDNGVWTIPVSDLLGAGMILAVPGSEPGSAAAVEPPTLTQPEPGPAVMTLPVTEVIALNRRADRAEAERDALRGQLATQARALELAEGVILRAIEAAPAPTTTPAAAVVDLREGIDVDGGRTWWGGRKRPRQ